MRSPSPSGPSTPGVCQLSLLVQDRPSAGQAKPPRAGRSARGGLGQGLPGLRPGPRPSLRRGRKIGKAESVGGWESWSPPPIGHPRATPEPPTAQEPAAEIRVGLVCGSCTAREPGVGQSLPDRRRRPARGSLRRLRRCVERGRGRRIAFGEGQERGAPHAPCTARTRRPAAQPPARGPGGPCSAGASGRHPPAPVGASHRAQVHIRSTRSWKPPLIGGRRRET